MAKRFKNEIALDRLNDAFKLIFDAFSTNKAIEQICLKLASQLPKSELDSDISNMSLEQLFALKEDLQGNANRISRKIKEIDDSIRTKISTDLNTKEGSNENPKKEKGKKKKTKEEPIEEVKEKIVSEAKEEIKEKLNEEINGEDKEDTKDAN